MKIKIIIFLLLFNGLTYGQSNEIQNNRPNYLFKKYFGIGINDKDSLNMVLKNRVFELLDTLSLLPIDKTIDYSKKYKNIYTSEIVYNEDWSNFQTITVPDLVTDKPTQRTVATQTGFVSCKGEDINMKITDKYSEGSTIYSYGGKYITISESSEVIGNSTSVYEIIYFFIIEEN